LGCTYCILQFYGYDGLTVFENRGDLFEEIENYLEKNIELTRFGTGEFTDSLLFELTDSLYDELIPIVSKAGNAVLEIKTKTANVHKLLKIKDHDNTIVSWTLNSDYIAHQEEKGAPDIQRRLQAALQVQKEGYKLAFHFDPIILHENWEDGYRRTVERIFKSIDPENIVYISLGTLRYVAGMSDVLKRMSKDCRNGEFIRAQDNKLRYFRPLRTAAYRTLKSLLKEHVDERRVYLCMENRTVWEDVFGLRDMSDAKLKERLDEACRRSFHRC
jgi:spore photoproduct lyase